MTKNVNPCDLFTWLGDFTDVPIPDGLDSHSLTPLCQSDSAHWSEAISVVVWTQNLTIKQGNLENHSIMTLTN